MTSNISRRTVVRPQPNRRQNVWRFKCSTFNAVEPEASKTPELLPNRQRLERRHMLQNVSISGVTFDGRQELIKQLQLNQILLLEREPWNAYDQNAVRVADLRGRVLGYIPRAANSRFTHEVIFGLVNAVVTSPEGDRYGARLFARPHLANLLLHPLPPAEVARFADLPALFGAHWPAVQAAALSASRYACEVTGIPKDLQPVQLVPQWRYNEQKRAVQLISLAVLCDELAAAKGKLEERVAAVAGLSPEDASQGLQGLQATAEGRLFTDINGLADEDTVQYLEFVRQRLQTLVADKWQCESLLVRG